ENFRSAAEMVPLLATGRLEVGHGSTSPGFFNALLAGVPVKIVTDATLMKPPGPGVKTSMHLLVRKDLEGQVRSVSDLRGRKVATNNLGTLNQIQMSKLLTTGGLTLDDVDI